MEETCTVIEFSLNTEIHGNIRSLCGFKSLNRKDLKDLEVVTAGTKM